MFYIQTKKVLDNYWWNDKNEMLVLQINLSFLFYKKGS